MYFLPKSSCRSFIVGPARLIFDLAVLVSKFLGVVRPPSILPPFGVTVTDVKAFLMFHTPVDGSLYRYFFIVN